MTLSELIAIADGATESRDVGDGLTRLHAYLTAFYPARVKRLLEPSEAMIAAGWKVANEIGPTTLGVISDGACAAIYRAMVSAAFTSEGW